MKINRNTRIIFLVEGETEQAIIKALNFLGNPIKFNLWNNDIQKILRKYSQNDIFIIIFDTDILNNITRFNENLKILKVHKFTYYLLQQTTNLEEELEYACLQLRNIQQLIHHLGAQGLSDCKSKIAQLRPKILENKLITFSLDKSRLWARPIHTNIIHQQTRQYSAADLRLK